MIVGILQVELTIQDALSLKDKRRVLRSIKDKLSHDFNISIAEVESQDRYREAVLGISMVGNDGTFVRSCLDKIVYRLRYFRGAVLVDYHVDLI